MDSAQGASFHDIGAMIAVVSFTMGWLLFAVSLLRGGTYARRGPTLLIAGFLAIPILTGILGVWGAVLGNAVLGTGWILLDMELRGARGGL